MCFFFLLRAVDVFEKTLTPNKQSSAQTLGNDVNTTALSSQDGQDKNLFLIQRSELRTSTKGRFCKNSSNGVFNVTVKYHVMKITVISDVRIGKAPLPPPRSLSIRLSGCIVQKLN